MDSGTTTTVIDAKKAEAKKSVVPKTGDESMLSIMIVMAAGSVLMLTGVVPLAKRRRECDI